MLIVVFNGMFSLAGRHGALDTSPAAMLKGPPRRRKKVVAPTLDEIHLLRELLEFPHPRRLSGAHPGRDAVVDVGLLHPGTHGLDP
jgi:hypothetical protein